MKSLGAYKSHRPQEALNRFHGGVACRSFLINKNLDRASAPATRRSLLSILSLMGSNLYLTLAPQDSIASDTTTTAAQFTSSEGFSFSYPGTWVVAFDRSGGRGDGAVTSVGDFTRFLVVGVFRERLQEPQTILDDATGKMLCIQPQLEDLSTMRFKQSRSTASEDNSVYDFEYAVEVCRGEIQEGAGGVLRCLVRSLFLYYDLFIP